MSGFAVKIKLDDFIQYESSCIYDKKKNEEEDTTGKVLTRAQRQFNKITKDEQTGVAKVNLADCLACAECVTSAETVILERQNSAELLNALKNSNKDFVVTVSPQSRVSLANHFGLTEEQAFSRLTGYFTSLGASKVVDSNFGLTIGLQLAADEFLRRYKEGNLPVLCSECPGFVCYVEKKQAELVSMLSTVKSPQQILGRTLKQSISDRSVYHLAIMPCYDKKLEAVRFMIDEDPEVDCVLATEELLLLLNEQNVDFLTLPEVPLHKFLAENPLEKLHEGQVPLTLAAPLDITGSGGYVDHIARVAAKVLLGIDEVGNLEWKRAGTRRNVDLEQCSISNGENSLNFLRAYGFQNIQNISRRIKNGKCKWDYIEFMACPSGCLNGGGQIKTGLKSPTKQREHLEGMRKFLDKRVVAIPEESTLPHKVLGLLDKEHFTASWKAVVDNSPTSNINYNGW